MDRIIDHWSSIYMSTLWAMTVYGNTEEEVKDRVGKAMQFFLTTFVTSTDYLVYAIALGRLSVSLRVIDIV